MKIFIIGNVASMMINFREEFIKKLVANKHDVYCLVSDYDDKSRFIISSFGATPLDYTLNAKGLNPVKDIKATYDLVNLFKKHKPDIVFSFFVKPVIFATIAAKIAKIARIVGMIEGLGAAFTLHKNGQTKKAKIIRNIQVFLYKLSLPLLDELIFLNKDDKKDLMDTYNIKTKSISILGGIGVDLNKFTYSKPPVDSINFIFIARLLAEKGIFEYLEAAKIVKDKHKDAKFYVLGSFDEQNPFGLKKEELKQYLDGGVIIYPGFVNNVNEWIVNSSVFVLPSYREGVPRSTQEAMATGRAVITTDSVGCKETVEEDLNGFLIPLYDSQTLAQKMIYFIQNPEKIVQMGIESRKIAEKKFNITKKNKELINIVLGN
ncbi:glycosyltransferase family 4 protein [Campylobacter sp. RM13119]|uniref:glycosyltransferase family 4 protein n=1 Tax=Campylobacter californiensis TaxID=1032243 RepID=UPI001475F1DC|nr:glycosyltransferase family 4 protein [Campylobacter sp. RM13119]MBE3605371.1 glycosyltransferase family 4 protein [Campylobacter sp. RM13119]